jgi:UDP-N-acetylmuramate dehydrogenase
MNLSSIYQLLTTTFPKIKIYQNHPLARYTTVHIGGPADIFISPSTHHQTIQILNFLYQNNLPLTILGNGSNVLISDSGLRGIVLHPTYQKIKIIPTQKIYVSSTTQLSYTINFCIKNKFPGLAEYAYIPSTIGGAIYGNIHGIYKNNFDHYLYQINCFDLKTGKIVRFLASKLTWDYDTSFFQTHPHLIIISALLKLEQGDTTSAKAIVISTIASKSKQQPMCSLGCVFKNPPHDSAGRIIDAELHLKAHSIGDAQISPLHANFIVNTGHATASDYHSLIKLIQSLALQKLNIKLETEIKFLGKF